MYANRSTLAVQKIAVFWKSGWREMCRQALESLPPEAMSTVRVAKAARKQIHNPIDIGCTYFATADLSGRDDINGNRSC